MAVAVDLEAAEMKDDAGFCEAMLAGGVNGFQARLMHDAVSTLIEQRKPKPIEAEAGWVAADVTPDLARSTIGSITVLGALQASAEVKAALAERTHRG